MNIEQFEIDHENCKYYIESENGKQYLDVNFEQYDPTEDHRGFFDTYDENFPQYMQLCVYAIIDGELTKLDFDEENTSEDSNIAGYYQGDGIALVSEDDSPNRAGIYICGSWEEFENEYLPTFYEAWGDE